MSAAMSSLSVDYDSTVVPFRRGGVRTSPEAAFDPREYFTGDNAIERAATMIQAMVTQQMLEGQMRTRASAFDAVYFSALEPDPVAAIALARVRAFGNVVDASDEIGFDDGMD